MKISVEDNRLFLKDDNNQLLSNHKLQLEAWNFKLQNQSNIWIYHGETLCPMCVKLESYFQKHNINFSVCPEVTKILKTLNENKNNFNKIKSIASAFKNGEYDKRKFTDFCEFLTSNIPRKLRPHQIKAAYHQYLMINSANFSVPGSGKTSVILTVFEKFRQEQKVNVLYVVGPVACFRPWIEEFEETLGHPPKYKILSGGVSSTRKSEYYDFFTDELELILTSFQTLYRDKGDAVNFFNHPSQKVFLVIDEAHYVKQIGGVWANSILEIGKYAEVKCVLTGTPCPRKYMDLFNLFDFLWPNNKPISDSNKRRIEHAEASNDINIATSIIKESIDPLFYRVRKKDLGLIPPVFHEPINIEMNTYEKRIYKAICDRLHELSHFDAKKNIELLLKLKRGRIIRLRQLVSYAKLLSTAVDNYNEDLCKNDKSLQDVICNYDKYEQPAKLETLIKLIIDIQKKNKKILIWSNFIDTIKMLENKIKGIGIHCKSIYGATPIHESLYSEEWTRDKIIKEFLDLNGDLNVLIANPAACAESISLHKSCYNAIYYDLSYNCAQYLQSLDRIHRVGGSEKHEANYYFLQYRDTVDQDILDNISTKADKMYSVIENDYAIYSLDMFEDDGGDVEAYDRIFKVK